MEKHSEKQVECFFDKKHSNQKTYRDSAAAWFTVPAMAKIQAKFGISEETINPARAVILMGKHLGIEFVPEDFDRSKTATTPKAQADKTNEQVRKAILEWFNSGWREADIIKHFKAAGWSEEQLQPYFKSLQTPRVPIVPLP